MSMSLITFISNLTIKFWEPRELNNSNDKNTICTDNYEPDLEAGEGYYYTKFKNNNILLYDLEMGDKRIIYE